jgi:hypothetical protein
MSERFVHPRFRRSQQAGSIANHHTLHKRNSCVKGGGR